MWACDSDGDGDERAVVMVEDQGGPSGSAGGSVCCGRGSAFQRGEMFSRFRRARRRGGDGTCEGSKYGGEAGEKEEAAVEEVEEEGQEDEASRWWNIASTALQGADTLLGDIDRR